ncbi:S-layer homology domain-containing protein [Paenibacillus ginsengarvi]|uniref:S-layer homology domain-containing protein n=1 Tax=Paenibacillus ginsengarvi TaxID=400777 RepID=A0A3B0CGF7_9BACL|nr:S-layer homology domain-containing protein [Paenibacillus ginsengarvi]RKN84270.1 S-layer homology domain-containing protein [Paenibacillus ginsengarvi]
MMKRNRLLLALVTAVLALVLVLPATSAYAEVSITSFSVYGEGKSYLIGGTKISYSYMDDRAISTEIENVRMDYSTDNGLNWLPVLDLQDKRNYGTFRLPVDPQITNVSFRLSAKYSPLIGSNSYPQKTAGPYPVKQPGEPSNLTAVANSDGSVTVSWTDNSNMESYYLLTRVGPEGTKYFNVTNGGGEFGPMSTVDKTTSKTKNTFYAYSVTPVIDLYTLPEEVVPGMETAFVVNKAPFAGAVVDNIQDAGLRASLGELLSKQKPAGSSPIYDLKPIDGAKLPELKLPGGIIGVQPGKGGSGSASGGATGTGSETGGGQPGGAAQSAETLLNEAVYGASDWAKTDIKLAIVQSLTTSAVLGRYQEPITREHFAGIAVKLYEALSGKKAEPISPNPFKDTSVADVLKANKLGIVSGISDDTFAPGANITRQELTVMLMRAVKAAKPSQALKTSGMPEFEDAGLIAPWALEGIHFAVGYGLMNGVGEGKIDPLGKTTREQAIVLVKRSYDVFK